jgi:hypothetical protein
MILFTGLNKILNFRGLFSAFRLTYLRNEGDVCCIKIISYQVPRSGVSADFVPFCFRHCVIIDMLSILDTVPILTYLLTCILFINNISLPVQVRRPVYDVQHQMGRS